MGRIGLPVLAWSVAWRISDTVHKLQKTVDHTNLEHQYKLLALFFHTHEINHFKEQQEIAATWDIHKNAALYDNATAVQLTTNMLRDRTILPMHMPFTILDPMHRYQVSTLFHLLYSAKTYDTFYKTAVYLREHVNEYQFVYVLSVAIMHRPDTQDIRIPPIYDVFPSYFHNGEVYDNCSKNNHSWPSYDRTLPVNIHLGGQCRIRLNETVWPYLQTRESFVVSYLTHDPALNAMYYNNKLAYPTWLRSETCGLKDRRGELFWFRHKQIISRYYMARLAAGLGEIPELGSNEVEEGYTSSLLYHNGISFPVRPDHFVLQHQSWLSDEIEEIEVYENRIRDVIDKGFYITNTGEHVSITSPDSIDVLGRLIEANVDSPNVRYYKDFISIWKQVLGNSITHDPVYRHGVPLVVPSVLEHYETVLRDPAFYMIVKRVLNLFNLWHEQLPHYTKEELSVPGVIIQNVDVGELLTYYDYTYYNVTNHLHLTEVESHNVFNTKSVLVQRPRLNHKVFTVRVNVKSEAAKHVTVRFFLAPKYDGYGHEIPLHINSHNFFLLDVFDYELKSGDNMITRVSTDNVLVTDECDSASVLFNKVDSALQGHGQYTLNSKQNILRIPRHLLLPKGLVSGMPFVLMVHITEYHAPNDVHVSDSGFSVLDGITRLTSDPLGFPVDRPLYEWQISGVENIFFEDVQIFHKITPEITQVPAYTE
uniref:Riboflavin binding hexamerin n=1 Tax=Corcyra cephalonica TaxID=139036 RepID=W8PPQ9_CORCP|nr:riboflavin binding hexamerin [Corcyra cephalonica]